MQPYYNQNKGAGMELRVVAPDGCCCGRTGKSVCPMSGEQEHPSLFTLTFKSYDGEGSILIMQDHGKEKMFLILVDVLSKWIKVYPLRYICCYHPVPSQIFRFSVQHIL